MKKAVLFFSLSIILSHIAVAQLNVTYVGSVQYSQSLNDVWGYVAPNGTEYALVGMQNGVSIVNLSDPSNPVESDFVPGPSSTWRDIKTWGNHAYVTNETGQGLLVIDLSPLPDSVSYQYWAPNIPGLGTLSSCHNLWIDEFGYVYLSGCSNLNGGGLLFVDVATDPGNPVYAGKGEPIYSHDVYVRNNIAYSSEIQIGELGVYDVSDKSDPVPLASQETPASATHNAWLSDDGNVLFTTDETGNAPVASYDVSDLDNIVELDQFRPLQTLGAGVIPHNVHVWNDWLIISYYTDGCIIVDGKHPDNLIEVGNFDTYIPANTGFSGAWGAYPFLPSGLILISDIENGLYILAPNYVRACRLEGQVTDAQSGFPITGATVNILGDLAFGNTGLTGNYKTGLATAGTYEVEVKKAGYEPATATVLLANDMLTIQDFALQPLASFAFSAVVKDEATGEPVPNAKVQIINPENEFNILSNAAGQIFIPAFYQGNYNILAGKWGYKTAFLSSLDFDENNNTIEIYLEKGIEDVFSLDLGWTVEGNAFQGQFERGNPIGVTAPPPFPAIIVQPEDDVAEDPGNSCYVTGNTADATGGVQITGTTRLVSPIFDLSGMNEPRISYYTWFFNITIQSQPPLPGNDKLVVKLTNGTETVVVDERTFTLLTPLAWSPAEINVKDKIAPTANMQIIFECGDNDPNFTDVIEAGVDFFQAYDANPSSTGEPERNGISLSAYPNPSAGEFTIDYEIENLQGAAVLTVFNLLGQTVERVPLESYQGKIILGGSLQKGIYFVKIGQEGSESKALKVVKQ